MIRSRHAVPRRSVLIGALLLGSALALGSVGAPAYEPARVDRSAIGIASDRRGLILEISGRVDGEPAKDARYARLPGLVVKRGEPVSPFLDPGIFDCTWHGRLQIDQRDKFTFHAVGNGDVSVVIGGEQWIEGRLRPGESLSSESKRLRSGLHEVEIRLKPRLGGRGALRLEWEARKFGREPIPATAFVMPDPEGRGELYGTLRDGNQSRRAGSLLVASRCGQCHEAPEAHRDVLEAGAPILEHSGLQEAWLARWILDPKALDDETFMPRMLQGPSAASEARDLAAYVASRAVVEADLVDSAAKGDEDRGGRLWADLGCFSCHDFSDPREPANWEGHNIPLGLAGAKFRPGAIAQFVQDPRRWRPGTAMPHFRLSGAEAADLEAFIRSRAGFEMERGDAERGDAERGRALFELRNCNACHAIDDLAVERASELDLATVLGSIGSDDSCLLGEHGSGRPSWDFQESEVRGFERFAVAGGLEAFGRRVPEEEAQRLLIQRRCIACHSIDGEASQWSRRIGRLEALGLDQHPEPTGDAEVEVLQLRPDLSRIGEKLRHDWLVTFLDEEKSSGEDGVVRTWLRARMPKLPSEEARWLAAGLSRMHGFETVDPPVVVDEAKVRAGRELVSDRGGFACTTCHFIGDQGPTTAFEVLGVPLKLSSARLRPDFYRAWMLDPLRYAPASKMPKYASDTGRTGLTEFFDGDAHRQFDAIWHFLNGAQELR